MYRLYKNIILYLLDKIKHRHMIAYGCDTMCPRCRLWHSFTGIDGICMPNGEYAYTCKHCGHESFWNYNIAPIPICIRGDMK